MATSATAQNVTPVDRRRAPRRLRRRRFLGTDALPKGVQPHPRSRRVLHPGLERGGAGAACRRDGAVRSLGYAGTGGGGAPPGVGGGPPGGARLPPHRGEKKKISVSAGHPPPPQRPCRRTKHTHPP